MKLWGGMFEKETEESVHRFARSLEYDARLYPYDIRASRCHAQALREAGVLDDAECASIVQALNEVERELDQGDFTFLPADEDIHSAVERSLIERLGPLGGKLRTARSRNDQVAADLRLFLKDDCLAVCRLIVGMNEALLNAADGCPESPMPGYTHMQPAQPVLFAHHLMAYFEMFKRDVSRFLEARRRLDVCPLGSGSLAGVTYKLDRGKMAEELGFGSISANSMDAVADRDFVAEVLFAASVTAVHLSRLSEEIALWSTAEFGFVRLDDAYSTGSSIMPQKRNPDVAELVRGKCARISGHLSSVLGMMKGLPLAYNRDLQEDKEAVFDGLDTLKGSLTALAGLVATMQPQAERMRAQALVGYANATDLADYLTRKGMPFREAHETTGAIVKECIRQGIRLDEMDLAGFRKIEPSIQEDVYGSISLEAVLAARALPGGTAPAQVAAALKEAHRWVKVERERLMDSFLDSH